MCVKKSVSSCAFKLVLRIQTKKIKFTAKVLYLICHIIVAFSLLTDNGTRHGRYGTYSGQTDECNGFRMIPHAVSCSPRGVRLPDTTHISHAGLSFMQSVCSETVSQSDAEFVFVAQQMFSIRFAGYLMML
jgi:hypothetical protein